MRSYLSILIGLTLLKPTLGVAADCIGIFCVKDKIIETKYHSITKTSGYFEVLHHARIRSISSNSELIKIKLKTGKVVFRGLQNLWQVNSQNVLIMLFAQA